MHYRAAELDTGGGTSDAERDVVGLAATLGLPLRDPGLHISTAKAQKVLGYSPKLGSQS